MNLDNLASKPVRDAAGNQSLTAGGAAAATGDISTAAAVVFTINGIFGSLDAATHDLSALPVLDGAGNLGDADSAPVVADGETVEVVLSTNIADEVAMSVGLPGMGTPVVGGSMHAAFARATLVNDSGADFIIGTTALADITATFDDVSHAPARPKPGL